MDDLTVSFTSTVTGPDLADLTGGLRLDVVIAAPDGWTAVVNSGPAVALEDGTATATVAVDAEAAADLLARHNAEIGAPGGPATLTVTPVTETPAPPRASASPPSRRPGWRSPWTPRRSGERPGDGPRADPSTPVEFDEVGRAAFPVLAVSVSIAVARIARRRRPRCPLVTLACRRWSAASAGAASPTASSCGTPTGSCR